MNQMSSLIGEVKKSVEDYSSELFSLKSKALNIRKSVCDLDDVIEMVQTSAQIQDEKMESLETLRRKTEEFVEEVIRIDEEVADVINQNKEDFYNKYNYLKPDAEKSDWEAFWDNAAKWCKEHWESICNVVIVVIIAAAVIGITVITCGGSAVLITLIVGALVGAGGQLISDVVSWAITGKWEISVEDYLGAML